MSRHSNVAGAGVWKILSRVARRRLFIGRTTSYSAIACKWKDCGEDYGRDCTVANHIWWFCQANDPGLGAPPLAPLTRDQPTIGRRRATAGCADPEHPEST